LGCAGGISGGGFVAHADGIFRGLGLRLAIAKPEWMIPKNLRGAALTLTFQAQKKRPGFAGAAGPVVSAGHNQCGLMAK